MSTKPLISLIMSVYNGEDYLKEAILSVCNQTFKDWELIVINDCSTDSTSEILKELALNDERIKVHTNEINLRLPSSLNKALSFAEGKYIARMDADDICLPERLSKQYEFMESHPDISLSSCKFMTLKNGVISSGGCGGKCDRDSVKALILVTNPILHPGIIARAEVIKALGYNPTFTCTEDMELWTRFVMGNYNVEIIPEYLMIYRLHDKQITATTLERQRNEVVKIQKTYYSELLSAMTKEQEEFYISGIYFRETTDTDKFTAFYKWLKKENKKTKAFKKEALDYALFEILAEYKRHGVSKIKLVKTMLSFGIPFLLKEIPARKKRAGVDRVNYIKSAEKIGLVKTGGTVEFPVFSQK